MLLYSILFLTVSIFFEHGYFTHFYSFIVSSHYPSDDLFIRFLFKIHCTSCQSVNMILFGIRTPLDDQLMWS